MWGTVAGLGLYQPLVAAVLDNQLQQDIDQHLVLEGDQVVLVAIAGWVLLVVETNQGTAARQAIHPMLSLQRTVPGYHYGARTESQTQPHLNNHLFSGRQ